MELWKALKSFINFTLLYIAGIIEFLKNSIIPAILIGICLVANKTVHFKSEK